MYSLLDFLVLFLRNLFRNCDFSQYSCGISNTVVVSAIMIFFKKRFSHYGAIHIITKNNRHIAFAKALQKLMHVTVTESNCLKILPCF